MKRLSVALVVTTLAAVIVGVASGTPSGPRANGSGLYSSPFTGSTRVSVAAFATGEANTATGHAAIVTDEWSATVDVTCIERIGEVVMIGGVVARTTAPAGPGWGAVIVIDDEGSGANERDAVGWGLGSAAEASTCGANPGIFPLHSIDAGNYVVF